jgi:KAT8 regulatory NSL complex subunit 2
MKTLRKRQPPESLETLIDDLQHYSEAGNDEKATGTLSLIEKLSLNASTQKLQDYASESDSEDELPTAEQTVRQEDDSDAESIDSDQDDPLRYVCFL